MAQPSDHDFAQPSGQSGTNMRVLRDEQFEGILTKLSGTTEPSTTFPYMWWIDTSTTPPTWNIRDAANSAWIKFAEIDASDIKLFSELAAVVGLANTDPFTEPQTIDKTGAAGSLTIRSDRTTGIAASLDLAGHDDGANDTTYVSIDAEITDDTDGSEDGQLVFRVIQAGSEVARMTLGGQVDVNGVLNADTLQQGGTALNSIIATEKASMDSDSTTATTVTVPDDLTGGERNRFTGSSASTWTINSDAAGNIYPVRNRGTADITFVAGSGVTLIGGTTLGQDKVCTIEYDSASVAFIYGQNT